jgi:hypothetical protein
MNEPSEESADEELSSIWRFAAPADVFSNRAIAEVVEKNFVGSVLTNPPHEV